MSHADLVLTRGRRGHHDYWMTSQLRAYLTLPKFGRVWVDGTFPRTELTLTRQVKQFTDPMGSFFSAFWKPQPDNLGTGFPMAAPNRSFTRKMLGCSSDGRDTQNRTSLHTQTTPD